MHRFALLPILALLIMVAMMLSPRLPPPISMTAGAARESSCLTRSCRRAEASILGSTVRMHLRTWQLDPDEISYLKHEYAGHATLRDGRFLVTHNHYLPLEQSELKALPITVYLYDSSGRLILRSPLSDFEIIHESAEILVFEMKYDYLAQRVSKAGITSATFADWHSLPLEVGQEVAQVDWNGEVSVVDWTTISEIITDDGIPRIVLDDPVTRGASGGGVFWNGTHIASNWQRVEHLTGEGDVVFVTSVAPLNDYR